MKTALDRRQFLKIAGISAAATGTLGTFAGCSRKSRELPEGEMEYRISPTSNDKVSLLGYGCMRWPETKDENGKKVVDQDMTNMLVDHAIANGVN